MTTYHLGTDDGHTPFCQARYHYTAEGPVHPVGTGVLLEPDRWCPACLKVLAELSRDPLSYLPPLKRVRQQVPSCVAGDPDATIV